MSGRRLLVAFGLWTLFVWATRVGTAFEQDDLSDLARAGRVGLALSFTVLGVVLLAVADHEAAFIVVHVVLAVISIALAVVTVRATTLRDRHGTAGHRRAEVDV